MDASPKANSNVIRFCSCINGISLVNVKLIYLSSPQIIEKKENSIINHDNTMFFTMAKMAVYI